MSEEQSSCGCPVNKDWDRKLKARYKELENMTYTDTYIPRNKVKGEEVYLIHFNGGRPFEVTVTRKKIIVKKVEYINDEPVYNNIVAEIIDYEGYWSGFDSSPYKFHGNSLLVKLNELEYIYIESDLILFFKFEESIVDFIAYMGNNDVAYPIAVGKENVYNMAEGGVVIPKKQLLPKDGSPLSVVDIERIVDRYYNWDKTLPKLKTAGSAIIEVVVQ